MFGIKKCTVLENTLLSDYSKVGNYTDCYTTDIPGQISFPEFIFAFYTTPLFKLERLILNFTISRPSTDMQAKQLANGVSDRFAAWHVEKRNDNEILMCDLVSRTRSWLMAVPAHDTSQTRLYFGSAVVPRQHTKAEEPSLEFGFRALLGFHQIYSVFLLSSARWRLLRQKSYIR